MEKVISQNFYKILRTYSDSADLLTKSYYFLSFFLPTKNSLRK